MNTTTTTATAAAPLQRPWWPRSVAEWAAEPLRPGDELTPAHWYHLAKLAQARYDEALRQRMAGRYGWTTLGQMEAGSESGCAWMGRFYDARHRAGLLENRWSGPRPERATPHDCACEADGEGVAPW